MQKLSEQDREKIKKYFGKELGDITEAEFKELHKEARKKFHPDNFAHFDDETVLEMAKDRFQEIEALGKQVTRYLSGDVSASAQVDNKEEEAQLVYRSEGMRIDIMTQDAGLKFKLFRSRFIDRGDEVKIKGTKAKLIALEDYYQRSAGFRETIKVTLSFGEEQNLMPVVEWLFRHISGVTSSFVIEGKVIPIDPYEILKAIRQESIKELKS